jgi:hypothetical protein
MFTILQAHLSVSSTVVVSTMIGDISRITNHLTIHHTSNQVFISSSQQKRYW